MWLNELKVLEQTILSYRRSLRGRSGYMCISWREYQAKLPSLCAKHLAVKRIMHEKCTIYYFQTNGFWA